MVVSLWTGEVAQTKRLLDNVGNSPSFPYLLNSPQLKINCTFGTSVLDNHFKGMSKWVWMSKVSGVFASGNINSQQKILKAAVIYPSLYHETEINHCFNRSSESLFL